MSNETVIKAQAGVQLTFQIDVAYVDESTDPATETPIDLTGCTGEMEFRARDLELPVVTLTTASGLVITPLTGVIEVTLTEAQTQSMAPDKTGAAAKSGRYAFKLDLLNSSGVRVLRPTGYLEVEAWP